MLMIVGGGPYLEILRKKAAELGVMESVILPEWCHRRKWHPIIRQETCSSALPPVRPRDLPMRKHWQQDCRYCVERMNVCGQLWKRAKRLAVPDGRGIPERFEELEGERIR